VKIPNRLIEAIIKINDNLLSIETEEVHSIALEYWTFGFRVSYLNYPMLLNTDIDSSIIDLESVDYYNILMNNLGKFIKEVAALEGILEVE